MDYSKQDVLLVEGIENWILNLMPMSEQGSFVQMKDPKTGTVFLVSRVENTSPYAGAVELERREQ